jgi:hypothetical protein
MSRSSDIGAEQRKHTALRTKAAHYRRMAMAIQANTLARHTFPRYVPRGKAPEWYYAKADEYERQSEIADTLASALSDARQQEWLDTRTPEDASMWVDNGLQAMGGLVEHLLADWPKLGQKLSADTRAHAQAQIRVMLGWLITALDGNEGDHHG